MNRFFFYLLMIAMCVFAAEVARAADLKLPGHAVAGQGITIGTSGDGSLAGCGLVAAAGRSTCRTRCVRACVTAARSCRSSC